MPVAPATLYVFLTLKISQNYPKMCKNCDRFFLKPVLTFSFDKKLPIKYTFPVVQE